MERVRTTYVLEVFFVRFVKAQTEVREQIYQGKQMGDGRIFHFR